MQKEIIKYFNCLFKHMGNIENNLEGNALQIKKTPQLYRTLIFNYP